MAVMVTICYYRRRHTVNFTGRKADKGRIVEGYPRERRGQQGLLQPGNAAPPVADCTKPDTIG